MKAGLAAYLEVVRQLQFTGIPLSGDVIIAGVVDEEHAMAGSKDFGLYFRASTLYESTLEPVQISI